MSTPLFSTDLLPADPVTGFFSSDFFSPTVSTPPVVSPAAAVALASPPPPPLTSTPFLPDSLTVSTASTLTGGLISLSPPSPPVAPPLTAAGLSVSGFSCLSLFLTFPDFFSVGSEFWGHNFASLPCLASFLIKTSAFTSPMTVTFCCLVSTSTV